MSTPENLASNGFWFSYLGQTSKIIESTSGIRAALQRSSLAEIPGVQDVRLLPKEDRTTKLCHKIYIVLSDHDIKRDRRVIELMCQFDDVEYDLVPAKSAGMVPNAARSIL